MANTSAFRHPWAQVNDESEKKIVSGTTVTKCNVIYLCHYFWRTNMGDTRQSYQYIIDLVMNYVSSKMIIYTWVDADSSKELVVHQHQSWPDDNIKTFKQQIAMKHEVPYQELFVCDVWKSKIHREMRNNDSVSDINLKSDDIFIYHSPRPDISALIVEQKENGDGTVHLDGDKKKKKNFQTFVIKNAHQIKARHQYGSETRYENHWIGYPLLITLSMKVQYTKAQIRSLLLDLVHPLKSSNDSQFELNANFGFNISEEMANEQDVFPLGKRNLHFVVQWNSSTDYRIDRYEFKQRVNGEQYWDRMRKMFVSSK